MRKKEKKKADGDEFETDSEEEVIVTEATRNKATFIEYPKAGRLSNATWNSMILREWVDHLPSVIL